MKKKIYMTVTEACNYLLQNTVKGVTYNSETSEMTITYNREDEIVTETFTVGGGDTSELEQAIENLHQEIDDLKSNKQDKLTAGSGITIDPDTNEISSNGVTYTAGANININENNEISCTVDTSGFVPKEETYNNLYNSKIIREDNKSTIKELTILKNSSNGKQSISGLITRCQNVNGNEPSSNNTRFKGIVGLIANTSPNNYINATEFLYDNADNTYLALVNGKITESINNKYKKVFNTSSDSYSEVFKYSPTSNTETIVTKEPFKYIGAGEVVLSSDVTVEEGFYEVTTFTLKQKNVVGVEYTTYKSLMGINFDEYRCFKNTTANLKNIITKSAFGLRTTIYTYNTSTTPETLDSTATYAMTQQS